MEIPKDGHAPSLPDIRTQDFPRLLRDLIGWQVKTFADLSSELSALRSQHTAVEHSREFGDVLDRLDAGTRNIQRLVQTAAALGISMEEPVVVPARERMAEVLRGLAERMNAAPNCPNCRQPWPVEGEVVPGGREDDGVPLADVVAFRREDPYDLL